ncbi:hypothetical protein C1752_01241 [Acaryochloris thomasi RCC1774]|uniref:MSMEG_0570 family protein n=1 Tax=Acaryochloris thomasi RCC1774 TaxID=1764569 RepID=A0A2W1JM84_9CYAN|nr:MSMEG_0570 family nitrogen starvation response protein [Acaryochloris thomasi]PZD74409.1 hypothetical protein C1752_01241 [Acaryochloris thomasi RCC1774]
MPEMRFQIEWPDGTQETCYSPSLVVKDYLAVGETYSLEEFVTKIRAALKIASDRVQAKYGFPCGLALGQLKEIESKAMGYRDLPDPKVRAIQFIE